MRLLPFSLPWRAAPCRCTPRLTTLRRAMQSHVALTLIVCLSLIACQGAIAEPQSAKETLVVLEETYTAAINTSNDLIEQKIVTGRGISDIIGAVHFADAALDNADAMVLAASQPTATQADKDNAAKALAIAQAAVASLVTLVQRENP